MSRVCQVTGKRPMSGNNVSHANNRTRRRFLPNLHNKRVWVESEQRYVKLRLSSKGLRIIDKLGIDSVLKGMRGRGVNVYGADQCAKRFVWFRPLAQAASTPPTRTSVCILKSWRPKSSTLSYVSTSCTKNRRLSESDFSGS